MGLGIAPPTYGSLLISPAAIVRLAQEAEPLDLDHVFLVTGYAPSLDEQVRLLERLQRAVQGGGG